MRFRLFNKLYAKLFGYFWLPCPICGRMFGGHEVNDDCIKYALVESKTKNDPIINLDRCPSPTKSIAGRLWGSFWLPCIVCLQWNECKLDKKKRSQYAYLVCPVCAKERKERVQDE